MYSYLGLQILYVNVQLCGITNIICKCTVVWDYKYYLQMYSYVGLQILYVNVQLCGITNIICVIKNVIVYVQLFRITNIIWKCTVV